MDQPKSDKFSELSPVLELVYVMLTNMAKYMDVYATDIEAEKTEQYVAAKEAVDTAIRKFDSLYGLKSPASTKPDEEVDDFVMDADDTVEVNPPETLSTSATPVVQPSEQKPEGKPYDFASGNDPDSLKKAKEAVAELKTLFADMKKQESGSASATVTNVQNEPVATPAPVTAEVPVEGPAPVPTPTFVSPTSSTPVAAAPTQVPVSLPTTPAESLPTVTPAPAAPTSAAPASDANEIDSILAELKKLQNKGSAQL